MINIGYMSYANIYPLFWHLEKKSGYNFIKGVPSELNAMLSSGHLDASPVSSLEYMNVSERYRIIPKVGICCQGPVKSVLLCSKYPIQNLCGKNIYLTEESLTSSALLKLILERFLNANPKFVEEGQDFDACLLIGDKALHLYNNARPYYTYDLSEIWNKFTKLPFVFSLWLTTAKPEKNSEMQKLKNDLYEALPVIKNNLETYAEEYIATNGDYFTRDQLIDYWNLIYYNIEEKEMDGLNYFYKLLGYNPKWYFLD